MGRKKAESQRGSMAVDVPGPLPSDEASRSGTDAPGQTGLMGGTGSGQAQESIAETEDGKQTKLVPRVRARNARTGHIEKRKIDRGAAGAKKSTFLDQSSMMELATQIAHKHDSLASARVQSAKALNDAQPTASQQRQNGKKPLSKRRLELEQAKAMLKKTEKNRKKAQKRSRKAEARDETKAVVARSPKKKVAFA